MSIDPRNDRICYYERILNGFVNADGFCNIRGAAEKIVEMDESDKASEQPELCKHADWKDECKKCSTNQPGGISKYLDWAPHMPECASRHGNDEICDCGLLDLRCNAEALYGR